MLSTSSIRLSFAMALLSLSACAGLFESQTARARAASDLSCPADAIKLESLPGNGYLATGCQKSERLTCMTSTSKDPIFRTTSTETSCMSSGVDDPSSQPAYAYAPTPATHGADGGESAADKEHAAFVTTMRAVLQSIPYRDCGATGLGKVELTVTPAGVATDVTVVEGTFDEATAACITERFGHVHVAAFKGPARAFRWKIDLGA